MPSADEASDPIRTRADSESDTYDAELCSLFSLCDQSSFRTGMAPDMMRNQIPSAQPS